MGSFKRGAGGQRAAAAVGFEDVRHCVERRLAENHVASISGELRRLRIKADTH